MCCTGSTPDILLVPCLIKSSKLGHRSLYFSVFINGELIPHGDQ
jgi:hypothetical protein